MLLRGPETVRSSIVRMAEARPEASFLISPETRAETTFADLRLRSERLAQRLLGLGLSKGDKVAFLLDNGLFTAELLLGAMYGGFTVVPANIRAGASHIAYTLTHSDARVVFVSDEYRSVLMEIHGQLSQQVQVIWADVDRGPDWQDAEAPGAPLSDVGPDDDALLIYTSGSTGRPKGAIFSQNKVLAGACNSILAHDLTQWDRSLCVLPLYHINAVNVTLISTLLTGGSVVMPRRFLVRSFWQWLTEHRCTWSALVPTIISQLLDWIDPRAEGMDEALARIRFLRSSSAPLAPTLHRAFEEKFKLLLIEAMGSTECCGNIFSNPLPPGKDKIGTPGLPFGFEAKVVGPDGRDAPRGEPGEIVLRGPSVMNGYYKDPEETAAVLGLDGWLRTGDLACVDEDGYFFVVGRAKELIIKGGMNIAPRQIDEVLESHDAVLEAAAVGIPDRYLGEDVVAFVVLRAGASCDERQLLTFCETRLGHFKTPSRIHVVHDLPKGPSGKVQRLKLVDEAARLAAAPLAGARNGFAALNGNGQPAHTGLAGAESPIEQLIAGAWAEVLKVPQVDVRSNFFTLGGDSLLAIQCLSRLREQVPITLSLTDFFEHATIAEQVALVRRRLFANIAEAGVFLSDSCANNQAPTGPSAATWEQAVLQRLPATSAPQAIPLRNKALPCPLSPRQERLWFMAQLIPSVPVYNEVEAVRLLGELNVAALEEALNTIVERHEVLRTSIQASDTVPVAVVHENWSLQLKIIDLSALGADERQGEVERLLVEEPRQPFHLQAEPGIRATLLRLAPEEHVFLLMMHHLICDWSSEGVIWRELSACYQALTCGQTPTLPHLPIQHGDYAVWQKQQMLEGAFADDLAYWEENLRGAPELLELPTDRPRPPAISYRGSRKRFRIGSALTQTLRDRCQGEKISLFTFFTSALNTLLYRYTGSQDILVGLPLADRDRPELQSVIGFLLHVHALRTQLSEDMTFRELLPRVQKGVLDLYGHRSPPFDQVVRRVRPERDVSYSPLVQVIINWRDRDQQLTFIGMEGLVVESLLADTMTSKFDLTLILTDKGDEIGLEMEYNSDLFDEARIERMVGHYQTLLEAAAIDPNQRLVDLPMLTEGERQQMRLEWNQTEAVYPKDRCVHELIEEQARRTPDALAAVFNGEQLTYRQLNDRANQLAHHLRELGVGPETLVGVCMGRSLEMVVGLLGTLKAGGAYVPLDPSHPKERLASMLHDSRVPVLLTHSRLRDQLKAGGPNRQILCLDTDWGTIARSPTGTPTSGVKSDNLAYVIYTSGSTGEPKGVEIPHRAVVNLLTSMAQRPGLSADDVLLAVTTISFDIAALELFLPLTVGGRVVLASREVAADSPLLAELLDRSGATVMQATPATWRMLIDAGWRGDARLKILCGGEALPPQLAKSLLDRCRSLWNVYGPTETTIWSTCERIDAVRESRVPIGRPIANTRTYILDAHGLPTPVGIAGELYIGGAGVARGYLNRTELTATRFLLDPFAAESGARMYRTGDRARYLPDGRIEFLGRLDNQVKVRGFRIELGEIEAVLERHPAVRQAAVVHHGSDEDGRLTAYVVAQGAAPSATELREHLRACLPDYMIPAMFVPLDALPLSPSGKVDRAALPVPDTDRSDVGEEYVAPRTPLEVELSQVWAGVLGRDRVGVRDNFFDLGGHSLLAVRLLAQIEKRFERRLPLATLFTGATIEHLAKELRKPSAGGCRTEVIAIQQAGSKPPLFFLPSVVGEVMYCRQLARHLGPDQPVYGIQMLCGDGTSKPLASLEAIAARCVEDLCAFQPQGPYRLAGYSFAGSVAYEMAQQLQAAGHAVDLVAIIDTGARRRPNGQDARPLRRALNFLCNLPYWISDDLLQTSAREMLGRIHRKVRAMWKGRSDVNSSFTASLSLELEDLFDLGGASGAYRAMMEANLKAFQEYTPQPYKGRITLLLARARPLFSSYEPDLGWGKYALGGVDVAWVPGNHNSILQEPFVAALAEQLKSRLDREETQRASPGRQRVHRPAERLRPDPLRPRPALRRGGGGVPAVQQVDVI
jgi:amino acid adenylation domain-containing protein